MLVEASLYMTEKQKLKQCHFFGILYIPTYEEKAATMEELWK